MSGALIGTLGWRINHIGQLHARSPALLTRLPTDPLVAQPGRLKPIRGEAVAKGTDRASFVILAAHRPLEFIAISFMGAEVNDATSTEMVMHNAQDEIITEPRIARDCIDVQRRVEFGQLQ